MVNKKYPQYIVSFVTLLSSSERFWTRRTETMEERFLVRSKTSGNDLQPHVPASSPALLKHRPGFHLWSRFFPANTPNPAQSHSSPCPPSLHSASCQWLHTGLRPACRTMPVTYALRPSGLTQFSPLDRLLSGSVLTWATGPFLFPWHFQQKEQKLSYWHAIKTNFKYFLKILVSINGTFPPNTPAGDVFKSKPLHSGHAASQQLYAFILVTLWKGWNI